MTKFMNCTHFLQSGFISIPIKVSIFPTFLWIACEIMVIFQMESGQFWYASQHLFFKRYPPARPGCLFSDSRQGHRAHRSVMPVLALPCSAFLTRREVHLLPFHLSIFSSFHLSIFSSFYRFQSFCFVALTRSYANESATCQDWMTRLKKKDRNERQRD